MQSTQNLKQKVDTSSTQPPNKLKPIILSRPKAASNPDTIDRKLVWKTYRKSRSEQNSPKMRLSTGQLEEYLRPRSQAVTPGVYLDVNSNSMTSSQETDIQMTNNPLRPTRPPIKPKAL